MQLGSEVIVAITDDGNGIDLDEILVVIEKNLRPLSFTPGMRRDPAPACRRGRGSDRWRSPLRGRVLGQDPGLTGRLSGGCRLGLLAAATPDLRVSWGGGRPGAGPAGSQRVCGLVLAGHVSGRACGFPGEPVVRRLRRGGECGRCGGVVGAQVPPGAGPRCAGSLRRGRWQAGGRAGFGAARPPACQRPRRSEPAHRGPAPGGTCAPTTPPQRPHSPPRRSRRTTGSPGKPHARPETWPARTRPQTRWLPAGPAPGRPPPQETRRSGVAAASKPRRQPPDKRPVKPGSWPRTLPRKGDLHRSLPLPRRHAGAGSRLIPGVNDSGRRFFSITTKISSR